MALPADFSKIFGSTATGGLTPIGDVNYAKGWEFVGSNPPTKNDFSYLQQVSDLKSQYLYKAIGGDSGAPAIGIPFFWPLAAMPNTVMDEWSDMVFLKFNGASFSASAYPKLALIYPSLIIPEARGEFLRVWDDGRGADAGRSILSSQGDAIRNITGECYTSNSSGGTAFGTTTSPNGVLTHAFTANSPTKVSVGPEIGTNTPYGIRIDASLQVPTSSENRPRNIAFNLLVRAK